MNRLQLLAVMRVEWQRGASAFHKAGIFLGVLLVGAAVLPPVPALVGGVVAALAGCGMLFVALMPAATDRLQGRLASWRTLPVPVATVALGRVVLAVVKAMIVPVGLLPLAVAAGRQEAFALSLAQYVTVFVALALLVGGASALVAGGMHRFRLERLFAGLFMVAIYADLLLGDRLDHWTAGAGGLVLDWLRGGGAAAGGGVLLLGASAIAAIAGLAAGARLAAWGIRVAEEHDPVTASALSRHRKQAALEYPAGRWSPVGAVTALQLRLASEKLLLRMTLLVGLGVLLPFLGNELYRLGRIYLPLVALAIPGAVAARTMQARTTGDLEALAYLPCGRWVVALGSAAAVAVLAVPATLVVVAVRGGIVGGAGAGGLLAGWALFTGAGVLAVGLAAWTTPVRTVLLAVTAAVALPFVVMAVIPVAPAMLAGATVLGPFLPVALAVAGGLGVLVPVGMLLHTRELAHPRPAVTPPAR